MEPRLVRSALFGLAIVALAIGASLIGREAGDPVANASELVASFYEDGDPGPVVDRLVIEAYGEENLEGIEGQLGSLLALGAEVTDAQAHTVHGVEVIAVTTLADDGNELVWCVLEDESLLIGQPSCPVGRVTTTPQVADGVPITAEGAVVQLFVDLVRFQAAFLAEAEEGYTAEGELTLSQAGLPLSGAFYADEQQSEAATTDLAIRNDVVVVLDFIAEDIEDPATLVGDEWRLSWDNGSVTFANEIEWFVEAATGA